MGIKIRGQVVILSYSSSTTVELHVYAHTQAAVLKLEGQSPIYTEQTSLD